MLVCISPLALISPEADISLASIYPDTDKPVASVASPFKIWNEPEPADINDVALELILPEAVTWPESFMINSVPACPLCTLTSPPLCWIFRWDSAPLFLANISLLSIARFVEPTVPTIK